MEIDGKRVAVPDSDSEGQSETEAPGSDRGDKHSETAGGHDDEMDDARPVEEHAPGPDNAVGQQRGDRPEVATLEAESGKESVGALQLEVPELDPLTEGQDDGALPSHIMQELVGSVAPTKGRNKTIPYVWTEERVNVAMAVAVSELDICKQLKLGDQTWSEVLQIFCRRSRRIDAKGCGVIRSAWWESMGVGLQGRRYSGVHGKLPEGLNSEERQAPAGFCALSAFALPKALKYILRCDTN